uniref:UDENN domain-containing protein n=1 Tax=Macrostomum lignano TaxID=282301 RepID=A0A1I8GIK7_9PLAT
PILDTLHCYFRFQAGFTLQQPIEEQLRTPAQLAYIKELLNGRLFAPSSSSGGSAGGLSFDPERCSVLLLHAGPIRRESQQPAASSSMLAAAASGNDAPRIGGGVSEMDSSVMSMSDVDDDLDDDQRGPLRLNKIADLSGVGPCLEPPATPADGLGDDPDAAAGDDSMASLADQLSARLPFRPLSLAAANVALAERAAALAGGSGVQQQVILALCLAESPTDPLLRGLIVEPAGGPPLLPPQLLNRLPSSRRRLSSLRELDCAQPRDRLPSLDELLDRLAGAPLLPAPQFDVRATYLLFSSGDHDGTQVTFCATYPGAHCARLFEPPPRLCNPLGCLSVRPRPWLPGSCARYLAAHLAVLKQLHGAVEREERVWSLTGRAAGTFQSFATRLAGLLSGGGADAQPLGDLTNNLNNASVVSHLPTGHSAAPSANAAVAAAAAAAAASGGGIEEEFEADGDGEICRLLRSRKPDLVELLWLLARDVQCAASLRRCFELYLRVVNTCSGFRSAYQLHQRNWTQLARCVRSQQSSLDSFSCPHLLLQLGAYRLQESLVHLLVCAHPMLDTQQLAEFAAGPAFDCAIPARLERLDRLLHLCEAAFSLARSCLPAARVGKLVREFLSLLAAGRGNHLEFTADVEANEAGCELPLRWELLADQRAGRACQASRVVIEACRRRRFRQRAGRQVGKIDDIIDGDCGVVGAGAAAVYRCSVGTDCRLAARSGGALPADVVDE